MKRAPSSSSKSSGSRPNSPASRGRGADGPLGAAGCAGVAPLLPTAMVHGAGALPPDQLHRLRPRRGQRVLLPGLFGKPVWTEHLGGRHQGAGAHPEGRWVRARPAPAPPPRHVSRPPRGLPGRPVHSHAALDPTDTSEQAPADNSSLGRPRVYPKDAMWLLRSRRSLGLMGGVPREPACRAVCTDSGRRATDSGVCQTHRPPGPRVTPRRWTSETRRLPSPLRARPPRPTGRPSPSSPSPCPAAQPHSGSRSLSSTE